MKDVEKKRKVWPLILVVLGLAYFLFGARPLGSEEGFKPRWVISSSPGAAHAAVAQPAAAQQGEILSFRLEDLFGFFTESGELLFSRVAGQALALRDGPNPAWAEYASVHEKVDFLDPEGKALFSIADHGAPWVSGGRLFSIAADDAGLSSWSGTGAKLWSRDLPSVMTTFSATEGEAAAGCLDGNLEVIDAAGNLAFGFKPGGSRLSVICGISLSPDGERLAVVSGIDPQRFLLFEKRSGEFKLKRHMNLSSDFRRRVELCFSTDGKLVFLEQGGRLDIIPVAGGRSSSLAFSGRILQILPGAADGIHILHLEAGSGEKILAFSSAGKLVAHSGLGPGDACVMRRGDGIYLARGEKVARLDWMRY